MHVRTILQEFVGDVINRIHENTSNLKTCLEELTEAHVWKRPNKHSNSVCNLLLNLSGNIRQWIISSLENAENLRERGKEFAVENRYSKSEFEAKLFSTIEEAKKIIWNISAEDILKPRKLQGDAVSGICSNRNGRI
jgi:hypothetical protein